MPSAVRERLGNDRLGYGQYLRDERKQMFLQMVVAERLN